MTKVKKSLVSLVLVFVCVFSMCITPASAAAPQDEIAHPDTLIYTVYYSRSECQEIYTQMNAYTSWEYSLIQALADFVGVGFFVNLNYNRAKAAFYKGGYVSGYTGCVMYVYDDAVPTVIAY